MANQVLKTVVLIALPASGKSEVRKYLEYMPMDKRVSDFHMGDTVQIDDFPYVHFMRCIDDELLKLGHPFLFYHSNQEPFLHTAEWGTLIELVNDDYFAIVNKTKINPSSAAQHLLNRIDAASVKVGLPPRLSQLPANVRQAILPALEKEAKSILGNVEKLQQIDLTGKTLVIEFARGGPQGSSMPLSNNYGYQYSIAKLAEPILQDATLLYIWVTPEESRRKNENRADPNDPGSILHHGVPIKVMLNDYGCDDIEWLEKNTEVPGTITVKAHGKVFHLPIAKFDNREDKTSFLRGDHTAWDKSKVEVLHNELKGALQKLAKMYFK